jgi:hypothetical protein
MKIFAILLKLRLEFVHSYSTRAQYLFKVPYSFAIYLLQGSFESSIMP